MTSHQALQTARGNAGLHWLTRLCFTPLAGFTAVFGPLLMLFPGSTADFWAWEIRPDMSAFWVGASYSFGAIAISTMLLSGRRSASTVPILATWPFAVVMLAATLIHNDRFFTGDVSYFTWFVIYLVLPFALPPMLWLSRDGLAGVEGPLLPGPARLLLAAAGIVAAVLGLLLVLSPGLLDQSWPWRLTPLMSRVIGGWLLFIATGALAPLWQPRYFAYRLYLPAVAVWFLLLLAGAMIHNDDFDFDRPAATLFLIALAVSVACIVALILVMERRMRHGDRGATASQA